MRLKIKLALYPEGDILESSQKEKEMKYIIIAIMIIATSFDVDSGGRPKQPIQVKTITVECTGDCPTSEPK